MGNLTRFWTRCRICFRLCRIAVLLLILALVCAVLWLNQIGLPDFLKQPLIDSLRKQGVALQFVRLRWNPIHGLMADNVRIGGETTDSPSLSLQELHLQLNYHALLHRKLQLDGVVLKQGTFVLPIEATNDPQSVLTIDHIQTELRFQTNDVWSLDNFQANFAGAHFVLLGQIAHAEAIGNLEFFHRQHAAPGETQAQLKKIARTLNEIHFNRASQVSLKVTGDARDMNSFSLHFGINAPSADTPWGSARNMEVVVHSITSTQKNGAAPELPVEIAWNVRLAELKSQEMNARFIACDGTWHDPTNIQWTARLAGLESEKLDANFISCDGSWQEPNLAVTNLYARLGGGELHADVRLNTATRELSFTNSSCFDLKAITALLTEKTRERLDQFSMTQPPEFQGSGSMILPDWTNRAPDVWRTEVQPTIRINGRLAVTNLDFSGISLDATRARFSYSNEIWTLPQVIITRPEGELQISGMENDATRDYEWHIRGALSPDIIKPFLNAKASRGFRFFVFNQPVDLNAELTGRLYDYDRISARGHASLQDFSIRGEHVDAAETDFHYANRVADFYKPHLVAGAQTMHADGVRLDYPGDRVYFTNGLGTADPQAVATAIGPIPAQVMRPYHFYQLPTAQVNGYAPLRDSTNADLDFKVVGTTPAGWASLKTPSLTGEIHWVGETLTLTNFAGAFYGGTGSGNAFFNFPPHTKGANFSCNADFQNVDVHLLATDLNSPTNHLEGRASGHFVVTSGFTSDWRSCNGYGSASLRDGLLWDVPVFGMLSPVLNAISPSLGNSRATDASAHFVMTNGIVDTDKLEIHTTIMRLEYKGTVDLLGDLNADVTAELFRDVPGFGSLLSDVTWPATKIFESKVTGTIKNPKSKPIYIPKILLDMLHPIHALEDLSAPKPATQNNQ